MYTDFYHDLLSISIFYTNGLANSDVFGEQWSRICGYDFLEKKNSCVISIDSQHNIGSPRYVCYINIIQERSQDRSLWNSSSDCLYLGEHSM